MSFLHEKAKMNADAAALLIDKHLFAPSVHCSYYSCFQLFKVFLFKFNGIDYNTQDKLSKKHKNGGTHNYIITQILITVGDLDKDKYLEIKNKIHDLRLFRMKSDYFDYQINYDQSRKALRISNDIYTYFEQRL